MAFMFVVSTPKTPKRGHARVDILGVGVDGGWGGVGWDVNVHCDCNHAVRSLALPHIRHATLLRVLLHIHTYVLLCCCTFSCTSTHTSCYAAARSLALPHIRHATLLHALLRFHTYTSCYEPEQLAMLMVAKLGKVPPNNKCQKNGSNGKTLPATVVSL